MKTTVVLPPLSALYGAAVRARLAAYRKGILSSSKLNAPVISIGNITVGGTGKTPLVEWVCKTLAREGRKVCVLTRGYKRAQPQTRVLVSDLTTVLANEKEAGDEAYLLAQNLLGIACVVADTNRVAGGKWAMKELGADSFVLDDGFQHLQIGRDLNVLTLDATDPWGGNQLLPYGRLREPLSGLSRADCVVITRAEATDNLDAVVAEVAKLTGNRPVFKSRMKTERITMLDGAQLEPSLMQQPLGAFCGVGNPKSFFDQVRNENFETALTRTFSDHHSYSQTDVDSLTTEAQRAGARGLITTAKDAVKLREFRFDFPCYVLEIHIEIERSELFVDLIRASLKS